MPPPSSSTHLSSPNCKMSTTASCFCGAVKVGFLTLCHLALRTTSRSTFANHGILLGNTMTSSFCKTCGTLMWRESTGQPDNLLMRIGTVDDKQVANEKLKPRVEHFVKDKFEWLGGEVPKWRTGQP
ncbi:hypothetical protein B0H11DRAFT_2030161 [Mycena galericulata]|nr:hypothetical protein B0H11DRAFT_2030161 [Mycena galericulata]